MNISISVEIKSLIIYADIYFSKNYFKSLPSAQHSSSVSHERFPWRPLWCSSLASGWGTREESLRASTREAINVAVVTPKAISSLPPYLPILQSNQFLLSFPAFIHFHHPSWRYDFDTHKIRLLCRHTVQTASLKKCHKPPPNLPQHFHKDGLELPTLCKGSIGNNFPKMRRKCWTCQVKTLM